MANSSLSIQMITKEAVRQFRNSNGFLASLEDYTFETIPVALSAKEVFVLGTAAIIANNPKVSRRFWEYI